MYLSISAFTIAQNIQHFYTVLYLAVTQLFYVIASYSRLSKHMVEVMLGSRQCNYHVT